MEEEKLRAEFRSFLREIAQKDLIDPECIRSELRLAEVINEKEDERIRKGKDKTERQVMLFLEVLPQRDPEKVISELYRISCDHEYDTLRKLTKEKWRNWPFWRDVAKNQLEANSSFSAGQSYDSESVQKAIAYLKSVYETYTQTMQKQWSKLLHADTSHFKFEEMYIDLEIVKSERSRKTPNISGYSDLFGEIGGEKIVLEGDPGMGKSTYLHKIAYDWAKGDNWLNSAFDLIILIRLGDVKPNQTLEQFLKEMVTPKYASHVLQFMNDPENHHKILFIFDAYDEFRNRDSEIAALINEWKLDEEHIFRNSTLLISSRIPQSQQIQNWDLLVRTVGLNEDAVLEKFRDRIENLEAAMEDKNKKELFKNPLFLGLGAALGHIPEELYDLINGFCKMVVNRHSTKVGDKTKVGDTKHDQTGGLWKKVTRFFSSTKVVDTEQDKTGGLWKKVTRFISEFAFVSLKPTLFLHNNLRAYGEPIAAAKDTFSTEPEWVIEKYREAFNLCCEIGLLWPESQDPSWQSSERKNLPSFPHQLFLEFFAAMYVAEYKPELITALEKNNSFTCVELREPFSYFLSSCQNYKHLVLQKSFSLKLNCWFGLDRAFAFYCPLIYKPKQFAQKVFNDFKHEGKSPVIHIIGNNNSKDGILLNKIMPELLTKVGNRINTFVIRNITVDKNIVRCFKDNSLQLSFADCRIAGRTVGEFQNWVATEDHICLCKSNELANSLTFNELILLEEITLTNCNLTQKTLALLIQLMTNPNNKIKVLNVSNSNVVGNSLRFFSALPLSLEALDIGYCNMTKDSLCRLIEFLKNPNCALCGLDVNGNQLIGESAGFMNALPASLRELGLGDCNLQKDALNCLAETMRNQKHKLERLDVDRNRSLGENVAIMNSISISMQFLRVRECNISKESVDALTNRLAVLSNLIDLEVSWNEQIGENADFIKALPTSLQQLWLSDCNLSAQSVVELSEYIKQAKQLCLLFVNGNSAVGRELRFAQSIAQSNLEVLSMKNVELTDQFLECFSQYNANNNKLESLTINKLSVQNCRKELLNSLGPYTGYVISPEDLKSGRKVEKLDFWRKNHKGSPKNDSDTKIKQPLCAVCEEESAGFHFGQFTCEGCKSFFGRCTEDSRVVISECKTGGNCDIKGRSRTSCKSCRLRKCQLVGMSRQRSRYGRRSHYFKVQCLLEAQQQHNRAKLEQRATSHSRKPIVKQEPKTLVPEASVFPSVTLSPFYNQDHVSAQALQFSAASVIRSTACSNNPSARVYKPVPLLPPALSPTFQNFASALDTGKLPAELRSYMPASMFWPLTLGPISPSLSLSSIPDSPQSSSSSNNVELGANTGSLTGDLQVVQNEPLDLSMKPQLLKQAKSRQESVLKFASNQPNFNGHLVQPLDLSKK